MLQITRECFGVNLDRGENTSLLKNTQVHYTITLHQITKMPPY